MIIEKLFSLRDKITIVTGVNGKLGLAYSNFLLENKSTVIGLDLSKKPKIF